MLEWFVVYVILNLVSFVFFAIDKEKAIKNKWRIPESTLIFVSILGIFGGMFGMKVMHHKTKKPKFYIGLPVILIVELVLFVIAAVKMS